MASLHFDGLKSYLFNLNGGFYRCFGLCGVLMLFMMLLSCSQTAGHKSAQNKPKLSDEEVLLKGKTIYEQRCSNCHQEGLAFAPKFRNPEDWSKRLAQKNVDQLCGSAIKGINGMPAKGTCWSCTEEEIEAAIRYMLPTS